MQIAQGSLVIVGANTSDCQVYFNGAQVEGITGINVAHDADTHRVVIEISETPQVAELKAAGITVRRQV